MPFGWMISAMVFYICLYYYIYQSYLDHMAETSEKRQLEDRKLRNILTFDDGFESLATKGLTAAYKKVPLAGWNFVSAPMDRENIAESVPILFYPSLQL